MYLKDKIVGIDLNRGHGENGIEFEDVVTPRVFTRDKIVVIVYRPF